MMYWPLLSQGPKVRNSRKGRIVILFCGRDSVPGKCVPREMHHHDCTPNNFKKKNVFHITMICLKAANKKVKTLVQ